jgi:hypothetical protein
MDVQRRIIWKIIIIIIIIIIMKSSVDRDNNYCHYVILRKSRLRNYATLSSSGSLEDYYAEEVVIIKPLKARWIVVMNVLELLLLLLL